MKLKANLHFHSSEDPLDVISYDLFEGIDKAASLGFNVLASTPHGAFVVLPEHVEHAKSKNILLLPGIEANIYEDGSKYGSHVVILNCDKSVEQIQTFSDLKKYRTEHPEIFVIAPHPFFIGASSLHERLEKYIELFDAIELSWFYTKWFNWNIRGEQVAIKNNKPYIATSDTHFFDFMDDHFVTIDATEKTTDAIFRALREGSFENTTSPRSLFDILFTFLPNTLIMEIKSLFLK
ncbi:PHP domain-containing protein [Candidatus Nomurabacteria bacterium]|nr:PHP domain-containing protein [Candidatus Kaiserbacteria bacterium]MCB9811095.1 PHP domain-containing protein [Candidatus Nomurabacteria bacterium]